MRDLKTRRVLIVEDASVADSAVMRRAIAEVEKELSARETVVLRAASFTEAMPLVASDMDIDALLVGCDPAAQDAANAPARKLLTLAMEKLPDVPRFLLADRARSLDHLKGDVLKYSDEFIWIFEDSALFIAGRILGAIERFRAALLPPLFRAIVDYNEHFHEYSYAAPGHQGGRGFTKSPVGKKFYDFYDENLFRSDTGIERTSIGSLLDHTGAFADCEKFAAETFGADASYNVVVGTSGANRTVMQAAIPPGSTVICDRNCHKSIEQGLILTGARAVYLVPTRNAYGIIGPIPKSEMTRDAIQRKFAAIGEKFTGRAPYGVVTNCTYDGLCYNADAAEKLLDASCDRIHFDEAWYAYARFNSIYRDHYAMRGDPAAHKGATVFATHSTHKLLTALSQASFIHIRHGRKKIGFDRFNQAYMMHATTSPLYAICASNDVAVKMMADNGQVLTQEVIDEAVDFRQALARNARDFQKKKEWFFELWNAPALTHRGKRIDFADAPHMLLSRDQAPWVLDKGDDWHGFTGIDDNWAMLDPIKVSILAPGIDRYGNFAKCGVPAALVASFLYRDGIVPTRATDFQLMFLFSIGITKGKWVTLLNALLRFKECYDADAPLEKVLPELVAAHPDIYGGLGIKTLGDRMFNFLAEHRPTQRLNAAFEKLPRIAMTPREAYAKIVEDRVELVPSDQLFDRVAANAIIPYPPGIPMLLSGERFGKGDCAQIAYLKSLELWDAAFPGFEHETEGATVKDGKYCIMCVKE